jgi:hypothetical protein
VHVFRAPLRAEEPVGHLGSLSARSGLQVRKTRAAGVTTAGVYEPARRPSWGVAAGSFSGVLGIYDDLSNSVAMLLHGHTGITGVQWSGMAGSKQPAIMRKR